MWKVKKAVQRLEFSLCWWCIFFFYGLNFFFFYIFFFKFIVSLILSRHKTMLILHRSKNIQPIYLSLYLLFIASFFVLLFFWGSFASFFFTFFHHACLSIFVFFRSHFLCLISSLLLVFFFYFDFFSLTSEVIKFTMIQNTSIKPLHSEYTYIVACLRFTVTKCLILHPYICVCVYYVLHIESIRWRVWRH